MNEIAGETVKSLVRLSRHRTLAAAKKAAENLWNGRPPQGTKIVDTAGIVYDPPSK